MKSKNKKICLLFAGGTTMSEKDIKGTSVNQESDINGWLEQVPEIGLMAQIEPVFILGEEEQLTGIELWQKVSQVIFDKAGSSDGFVIIANLNIVLNLGIALSFALPNLHKPLILTSSQITPESIKLPEWPEKKKKAYGGLGVKANLINSVQAVNLGLATTALMFGNRIIRPVKAKRVQTLGLNIFESLDGNYLGKIDFGISLTEKFKGQESKPELKNKFEQDIQVIEYFPGLDVNKQTNSPKGIIIRNLISTEELNIKDKPVLVYNRFIFNKQSKQKNVIIAGNITWETAVIKFMWGLASGDDLGKVMETEYCHEFIHH